MWVKFYSIIHTSEICISHIKVDKYCLLFSYIALVFVGDLFDSNWVSEIWGGSWM